MKYPTLMLVLLAAAAGCDAPPPGGSPDPSVECTLGGKTYRPGETFPALDGCNTCTCLNDGQIACSARACAPTCLYDGQRRMVGESFPATDGCNTCTCLDDGQVACTKKACNAAGSWLTLLPKQCRMNAWEQGTYKGDGKAPPQISGELLAIDNYFEEQGIDLLEVGLLVGEEGIGACTACDCARGDRLVVRAKSTDGEKLVNGFGFRPINVAGGEALSYAPKQCQMNPWQPADKPLQEARNVLSWAQSLGAPLAHGGFVYMTVDVSTCGACSCPRGDRLVVFPKAAQGGQRLTTQGFTQLPTQ